jgi:hypothetical protein
MMDKEFIQHTIQVWQPYYRRSLSEEDAREIIHNMTGFFNLLAKWKAKCFVE